MNDKELIKDIICFVRFRMTNLAETADLLEACGGNADNIRSMSYAMSQMDIALTEARSGGKNLATQLQELDRAEKKEVSAMVLRGEIAPEGLNG